MSAHDNEKTRAKLMGLGSRSLQKSYYPELRTRLEELVLFRSLLEQVQEAIFIVDADTGIILDTAGSPDTMLGCAAGNLVGSSLKELLPEHVGKHMAAILRTETGKTRLETTISCPNCPERPPTPVEISIRITEKKGKPIAILLARDITERLESEAALRQLNDELELRVQERTRELKKANKTKSEFLSIVSHELRTPLTSIIGFARIIERKLERSVFPYVQNEDDKVLRDIDLVTSNLDIIIKEGDRLTSLINNLLDIAKLEANKLEYYMDILQPERFIERAAAATRGLFVETAERLMLDMPETLPSIRGDESRLIQVMINLISNAVKYGDDKTIICEAHAENDHLFVAVHNTGKGIDPSLHEAIFDKFTQVDHSLGSRVGGTGLGLPICKHIIAAHGGKIWVESAPDQGASFIFTLPVLGKADLETAATTTP